MNQSIKPILSFTSHKTRLPLLDDIFRSHVEIAKECGMDVCFSCQDDSLPYLTEYQMSLINSGVVELLHVPKDHGSNTKWTLCRKAHPDAIMVVVDDDWIYDVKGIKSLLETHNRYPDAILCRAYRTIPWIGSDMPLYEVKPYYTYPKTVTAHVKLNMLKDNVSSEEYVLPSGTTFLEHFLGVLYPPFFPECDPCIIPDACLKDDDVFVGARVSAEKRPMVFVGRPEVSTDEERELPNSLWEVARRENGKRTFDALKSVQGYFRTGLNNIGLGQVFLMTCKKYPIRRKSIKTELARLGILFDEVYDEGIEFQNIGFRHKRLNRCHLAKYNAMSRFITNPTERVTLIEDDVRFLKNISEISNAINTIPEGFGVCRLSWGVSPYVRNEIASVNPKYVVEIERKMAEPGAFWAECPWASTDGCTIISKDVAFLYHKKLETLIKDNPYSEIDNSDDLLCRVCDELNMPMYAFKPIACIQVLTNGMEKGKSASWKFLSESEYHVRGIVRNIDDYFLQKGDSKEVNMPCTDMQNIHRGYNLYRKQSINTNGCTTSVIPPRYGADLKQRRIF